MKVIITIALALLSSLVSGQSFIVTEIGLRDSAATDKSYVVVPLAGLSSKQLYDNAIKYVNKNYKNPEKVIKGNIEGEYLRINPFAPNIAFTKNGGVTVFFDAEYYLELSFKDEKMKYEIVELNIHASENNWPLKFMGGGIEWYIFNKKGELKQERMKQDIEGYFNSELRKVTESIKGNPLSESW